MVSNVLNLRMVGCESFGCVPTDFHPTMPILSSRYTPFVQVKSINFLVAVPRSIVEFDIDQMGNRS